MTKSVFSEGYRLFRELLREARKKAGLTQARLSTRLGRPQSYVAKYEQGERRIDVVEFLEIAEALRLRPGLFISGLHRTIRKARRLRRQRSATTRHA